MTLKNWFAIPQFWLISLLASMTLLLTGCGFHLRGNPPLPPNLHEISIQSSQPYGPLTLQLTQIFRSMHIQVVPPTQHPPVTIVIDSESVSNNTTIQSASSSIQQYIMYYTVVYHLVNAKAETIYGPKTITLSEPYSINQNQVLNTDSVQQSLEQELQQQVVYQIIQQLGSQDAQVALTTLKAAPPPQPKPAS